MAQVGATLASLLYCASCGALTAMSFYGVPWSAQGLGSLIFLSAFPLIWLNERRAARMNQLLAKSMRKMIQVTSLKPQHEGDLVMVVGPLMVPKEEKLSLPVWGVDAPPRSAALRVQVETFRPLSRWSPLHCCCRPGYWADECSAISSSEVKALSASVGAFRVSEGMLETLDAWEPFEPAKTPRLVQIVTGAPNTFSHTLRLETPFPFAGERPRVIEKGSVLYYQRSGRPEAPAFGDIRVTFLHLPSSDRFPFTAVGVQRGDGLEPFRYKTIAPASIEMGRSESFDFNLGPSEYQTVPTVSRDGSPEDDAEKGKEKPPASKQQLLATQSNYRIQEESRSPTFMIKIQLMMLALSGAFEAWRQLLHQTAPERLLGVAPGAHGRFSFVMRAYFTEAWLTWRWRIMGYLVMVAGLEIALWKWEVALTFLAGPAGYALWVIALVGSGGFTAITAAAASIFYQPVSAIICIVAAISLFAVLLGTVPLLMALGVVWGCMCLLGAVMLVHLALPC